MTTIPCPTCKGDGRIPDKTGGGHHGRCPECRGVLATGMTKAAIAKALGYRSPALQVPGGKRCTLRTLRRLEVLRALVVSGRGFAVT